MRAVGVVWAEGAWVGPVRLFFYVLPGVGAVGVVRGRSAVGAEGVWARIGGL